MSALPFPEGVSPEQYIVALESRFRKTIVLIGTDEWEVVDIDSGSEAFFTPEG